MFHIHTLESQNTSQSKYKSYTMNIYKNFLYQIRKIECEKPYLIIIREYPTTYLFGYLKMLIEVPFLDFKYHIYYGEIRKIIYSFLNFYTICISHTCKKAEDKKNLLQYDDMMHLFEKTVSHNECSQEEFLKEFQPIESPEEQEKFDEILLLYSHFKEDLMTFGEELKGLVKQDKIEEFAKDHFTIAIEQTSKLCEFSHIYISKWLADQLVKIRVSLESILHRIRINYTEFQKNYENQLNCFYNELYELNKEAVSISRNKIPNTHEAAANLKRIAIVRDKIQAFGNYRMFARLDVETKHWSQRLANFEEIASIITKIKTSLDFTKTELEKYNRYEVNEQAMPEKKIRWHRMGANLDHTRVELEEKYTVACRPLLTFFSCRGIDRILYSDNIGSYYIDEYGHQNYITHYGAKFYHVDCQGNYLENIENEEYYFDHKGRYVFRDKEKLYQLAPCTSVHVLENNGRWRHQKTCSCTAEHCSAHLDRFKNCRLEIHDLTDVELLPKTEVIDISSTLDADTVKFMWNSYGWVLPEVLYELGISRPKNPIHTFAHLSLYKSHASTAKEIKEKRKNVSKYREDIIQQRKDYLVARARAWKAKQPKPIKPKDYDTSYDEATYSAYDAHQYPAGLSMYYD